MTILDDLPGIVAQSVGSLLLKDLNVIRVARNAADGRGGFTETKTTYAGRGLVTQFSDLKRMVGDLPPHARQVIIQAEGLAITPTRGDLVEFEGKCWKLTEAESPPGQPIFECVAEPTELSQSGDLAERTGSLSQTLADIGFVATGSTGTPITGALSITLDDIGQDITGTVSAFPERTGGVSQVLGDIGTGITAEAVVQGALSQQLQTIQSTAAANNPITGGVAQTLQPIGFLAEGGGGTFGSLAQTLQPIVSSLAGDVDVGGGASETMDAIGFAASGEVVVTGAVSQTLQTIQSTAGGDVDIDGSFGQTLQPIGFIATADNPVSASLAQTLQPIGQAVTGAVIASGSVAQTLAAIGFAATGTVVAGGGNEAETDTLIAAMTVAPDATREGLINDLIADLKADGIWAKLDGLWIQVAHDQQAGLLNWVAPGTFTATLAAGSIPVDQGFLGSSSGGTLKYRTGWTWGDRVQAAVSDVHVGQYHGFFPTPGSNRITVALNNNVLRVNSDGSPGPGLFRQFNKTGGTVMSPESDRHMVENELGGNNEAYVDGVLHTTSTFSLDTPADTDELQAGRNFTLWALHVGAGLTATELTNFATRLDTYFTAIGPPI